jgi:diguanylate cyclase (GGDEF)-like protein
MSRVKKTPVSGADQLSESAQLLKFIYDLIILPQAPDVPGAFMPHENFREVAGYISAMRGYARLFSQGKMDFDIAESGYLAECLKELQAKLRHLVSFADSVAAGDYGQHIDFMGDFSDAFNRMSADFRDTLKSLRDSEARLMRITKDLHISEERWKLAIQCTQDGVWDIDLIKKKAFFSPRFWEILRLPVRKEDIEFNPVTWGGYIHPDNLARWSEMMNAVVCSMMTDRSERYMEFRVLGGDGKYRWLGSHHMVICNAEGVPSRFVGTCEDIQEKREREDEIRRHATLDQLTKLPNRYLYNDRFLQKMVMAKRNATSLVLLLWDLDGFKKVNDTYGHLAGDRLLVVIAELLKRALREADTLARFGGDEFVMLLSSPTGQEEEVAKIMAFRVFSSLKAPIDIGAGKVRIGASCGVSFFPRHGDDGEALFNLADKALYQAKRSGKNRYFIWAPEESGPNKPKI